MSVSILTRPIKSGCNFNAVGNPVVYKLQRQDYAFNQINDSGGFAQIQINGADRTAYFQVGDTVYIGSDDHLQEAEITASSFSGGNTLITTDIAFVATDTGFLNNLSKRTDYLIQVKVYNLEDELLSTLQFSPMNDGLVYCDVSSIARPYIYPEWNNDTANSSPDDEAGITVYISMQEYYDGAFIGSESSDVANPIHVIHAALQLMKSYIPFVRNDHGGNMLDYFPSVSTVRPFLTRVVEPIIWRNWPFTVSFLWPDNIAQIRVVRSEYDREGNLIITKNGNMVNQLGKVGRINVFSTTLNDLDDDTTVVKLKLQEVNPVGPVYTDITEELILHPMDPCANPVHLFFKNYLGGDTWWQFSYNQEYSFAYSQGRKVSRMTLIADDLTQEQFDALQDLQSATEVFPDVILDLAMDDSVKRTQHREDQQVYMVSEDGEKIGVTVVPTGNSTMTKNKKHTIEIQIELPEYFTA